MSPTWPAPRPESRRYRRIRRYRAIGRAGAVASARRRDHSQVAPTANLGVDRGEILPARNRTAGLPDRFGQRDKIVHTVWRRVEFALVPDEVPAARSGKTSGVLFAEVVRVRFGERGERTDDGGRIGVHVGQRRDGKPGAAIAGATPWRPHRRTLSPRAVDRWLRHAAIPRGRRAGTPHHRRRGSGHGRDATPRPQT
jgi:hypothetical protein